MLDWIEITLIIRKLLLHCDGTVLITQIINTSLGTEE